MTKVRVEAETLCAKHLNIERGKGRDLTVRYIEKGGFCDKCGKNCKRVYQLFEYIEEEMEQA